jgi:hypothetical protein
MKAAIEAIRSKEMGSCKASRVFNVPQTTLERYMKDREKSSNEAIKTKLGRKQVRHCEAENDLVERALYFGGKKVFWIDNSRRFASHLLAVRNGIKNQFCKRNENDGRK